MTLQIGLTGYIVLRMKMWQEDTNALLLTQDCSTDFLAGVKRCIG